MKSYFPSLKFKTTAKMVAAYVERGDCPSDEMLLEAAEGNRPRLLRPIYMKLLSIELGAGMQRRGRPTKDGSRREILVKSLARLRRSNIPPSFMDALRTRLQTGKRFSEFDRSKISYLVVAKRKRDSMICYLYREFYELLGSGATGSVEHPVIGRVSVASSEPNRHQRAAEMTRVEINRLTGAGISTRTILNLIAMKIRR